MDPTETLRQALIIAKRIIKRADTVGASSSVLIPDGIELAERFVSLDEWLSRGGHLPKSWQQR
jgi:hypothetical protein